MSTETAEIIQIDDLYAKRARERKLHKRDHWVAKATEIALAFLFALGCAPLAEPIIHHLMAVWEHMR
jgi:hypothetical protein